MTEPDPIYAQMIAADPYIGTIATQLLQCLCDAAAANPNPPANCCFRVGFDVAQDMGALEDLCCQGMAYVALGDMFPTAGSFPDQDTIYQAINGCPPPTYGLQLKVGLMRCAPTGDQNFPPSCDDWNQVALQNIYDTKTLSTVTCCFRNFMNTSDLMVGWAVVFDRQSQASPLGGCIERSMTVTVQIPNCYCTTGA